MKRKEEMIVNDSALFAEIIPAGISLIAVLGFFASKLLSRYRLKAMAALRARTIQRITRINFDTILSCHQLKLVISHPHPTVLFRVNRSLFGYLMTPRKNPISANGIAKMVWENFMRER